MFPYILFPQKPSCSPAEKSFGGGILAESVVSLGEACVQFVPQLLPALISGAQDKDDEVRSNSVFGLGVLAEHGGASMHKYPIQIAYIYYFLLFDMHTPILAKAFLSII